MATLSSSFSPTRPKHEQVAENLGMEIQRLEAGAVIPPVTDLMDRFQVSQGTVVQALRSLRSKGLIARPPGKKRLIATGPRRKKEVVLNVLLLRPQWASPDYDEVGCALQEEATRQRLHLDILQYGGHWREDMRSLVRAHDALVAIPSSKDVESLAVLLDEMRLPTVMLWGETGSESLLRVADDDFALGRLAGERLLGMGHRRIAAFLSEPPQMAMQQRLDGWAQALREAGVSRPEDLVIDCSVDPGRDAIVGSYEKLRRWLFQNDNRLPATAVFCLCWTGALGMLRALREVGLDVPGDISILTHGGENRLCEFSNPSLSVVQTDVGELARSALGLLKDVCLGIKPDRREILLPPFFLERESTRTLT